MPASNGFMPRRLSAIGIAVALLVSVSVPALATEGEAPTPADESVGALSAGNFACELPRARQFTICQTNVRKTATQRLNITNISSGGRQVQARAQSSGGSFGPTVNMSPGDTRILLNEGSTSTYRVEARTRFTFVSATLFNGRTELR